MTNRSALVLFGDVVGSRRDSVGSTAWLRELVAELDTAYGEERLAPFGYVFRMCWRMAKPITMIGM